MGGTCEKMFISNLTDVQSDCYALQLLAASHSRIFSWMEEALGNSSMPARAWRSGAIAGQNSA